ncbi:putative protein disulfide-isomerase [Ceratocystis fimbriata CBS 114723]|uniref:protein disulfide-isomerase n=1 Tax=Ceratocystis fimbriata CBS 114723 TaxID=1035309 RepID=A0A2C5WUV4_9PEZI|nr:putative protein disulfide-isomerase [Ceratocystis fimbriata CBS 114723]
MHHPTVLAAIAALLCATPGAQAAFYPRNSPVMQVESKTYDQLITQSNYTSIVKFYAPWCGHCQNLKPAYEKAAQNLAGLANVAAINCDEDVNKGLCSSMGIQGFPTLKIVRPGKKRGRPIIEDYRGERSAGGIVNAVTMGINNHVIKVTDKDLDKFLESNPEQPRALLFTDKGVTSTLVKSLAIDFLSQMSIGQVRNKEKNTVEKYNVKKFPTLVLLPASGGDPIFYDGEIKKEPILDFLAQAATPNPDAFKIKSKTVPKDKKPPKDSAKDKVKAQDKEANEKPKPAEATLHLPTVLSTAQEIQESFLSSKSKTSLVFLGPETTPSIETIGKYLAAKHPAFPFYTLSSDSPALGPLRAVLGVEQEENMVVVNYKRGWVSKYDGDFTQKSISDFMQAVVAGSWKREDLPKIDLAEGAHDEL